MGVDATGLRERKKRRTRETIIREALALFAERGFERTTIADIAAASEIAPRTFFGYFSSKEDVVFHDFEETFARFTQRLRERAAGETAFDAMRSWLAAWAATTELGSDEQRLRRRLIRTTPALQASDRAQSARFEQALADAVAEDLGVPPASLRPHLVSAAALAAMDALDRFYDDATAPTGQQALAVLDEALVFLRGGFDALRRVPPAAAS